MHHPDLGLLSTLLIWTMPGVWWISSGGPPHYLRRGRYLVIFGIGIGMLIYETRLEIYTYFVAGYWLRDLSIFSF